ncbi:MAG: hypothetical protein E6H48_01460 [Betaproteobacteria bacterium]|nr:MAG: hypothetical protein E6H71_14295 [Betaproteobacteria bacterium]TMH69548.1 MAG: hypothetical protein E6H48_01460 [Betaproteobacteria bacterium]
MRTAVAATALALLALAPTIGAACEYNDASSASATPVEQMAAASTPAASKVPAPTVAKALAPNAVKQVAVKVKTASDQKLASGTTN